MSEKMIFCLGEGRYVSKGIGYQQNLMIFNKKVSDILDIKNFKLPIAKWIELKDMTKDEEIETRRQMGGYLKTLSYKDSWKEMWSGLSKEDKEVFSNLPNFDNEIFEKITGIRYELVDYKMEEAMKLLKDNGYKIIK
jgi:hypothetical protein